MRMANPTTCSNSTMFLISFITASSLLTTTQSASFISTPIVNSRSRINTNEIQYPPPPPSSSNLFSSYSSFPSSSSSSSTTSSLVLDSLSQLYPPTDLESRNALSRTDGYWKYISKNLEPPLEYTYGEFDFVFFSELLSIAISYLAAENNAASPNDVDVSDKVFIDIGSGTGRLVLGAAALYSWKECRGVEILEGIHQQAKTILESCHNDTPSYRFPRGGYYLNNDDDYNPSLPLSPITLTQASFTSPYASILDADVAFVFSSCMSSSILSDLAISLGRQCRPGTLVVTTEYPLPLLEGIIPPVPSDPSMPHGTYKFELLRQVDGTCDVVGGVSTAYIHRVVESLHVGERVEPERDQGEMAFELVRKMEEGTLTDTEDFLRGVRNDMIFEGFPREFLPDLD